MLMKRVVCRPSVPCANGLKDGYLVSALATRFLVSPKLFTRTVDTRVSPTQLAPAIPHITRWAPLGSGHSILWHRTSDKRLYRINYRSSPYSHFDSRSTEQMQTFTLSQYLREKKAQFFKDDGKGWTIVVGNEAGDLDTIASSIGLAWYYHSQADENAIALLPTARTDFALREENTYALALAGITSPWDELLCPEDLSTNTRFTSYALVDHNTLQDRHSSPDARVIAVVDHHEDEGKYRDTASPRVIQPAGSCASLVTGLLMSRFVQGNGVDVPPQLASILSSAIAIDTHGLRKDGKALDVDRDAASWLFRYVQMPSQRPDSTQEGTTVDPATTHGFPPNPEGISEHEWMHALGGDLNSRKHAIFHLSTRDLLRRDYKQSSLDLVSQGQSGTIQAGLATVPLPLRTYFSSGSATVIDQTVAWMEECKLSILGVLTTYGSKKANKARREELWIVNELAGDHEQQGLARTLFDGLEANQTLRLRRATFSQIALGSSEHSSGNEHDSDETQDEDESDPLHVTGDDSPFKPPFIARVYKQMNIAASRKSIAPVLKEVLGGRSEL